MGATADCAEPAPVSCPVIALCNSTQSGSPSSPSAVDSAVDCASSLRATAGASAACTGAGSTAPSPSRAKRKAPTTSAEAGRGCVACANSPNMFLTHCVAAMMVSIKSVVSFISPLRNLSNRFSVQWHSVTSSVAFRKPAPPLIV